MLTSIMKDRFWYIEKKGSVTAHELAMNFGMVEKSAEHWLSLWTSRGYLTRVPAEKVEHRSTPGRPKGACSYKIGKKWWGGLHIGNEAS